MRAPNEPADGRGGRGERLANKVTQHSSSRGLEREPICALSLSSLGARLAAVSPNEDGR